MLSSKCETCRIAFTSNVDSPLQEANTLISIKDYRAGALVRPSEVANAMFEKAEKIFRSQRDSLAGQKMIWNKMTTMILEVLKEEFTEVPTCHLRIIFHRFVKARFHFWADFTDIRSQKEQKKNIDSEANSSRTSKRMKAIR